jgi:sec-independent protein translocase protein TatA
MGLGGISIWQLVIILAIVLLLFGTKRLRNLGGDVGGAIKGFKKAMNDDDASKEDSAETEDDLTVADAQKSAETNNEKTP